MQEGVIDIHRLSILIQASIKAGRYFAARVGSDKQVTQKTSAADVVTEVDKAAEEIIRGHIRRMAPDDVVLGEEGTAPGAKAAKSALEAVSDAAHLWIIDPIDGTTNFVSKIPLSVVSLAYAAQGELKLGAVYDPYRDELFYAVRGHGAWRVRGEEVLNVFTSDATGHRVSQHVAGAASTAAEGTAIEGAASTAAEGTAQITSEGTVAGSTSTERSLTPTVPTLTPSTLTPSKLTALPGERMSASSIGELRRSVIASGFPTRADHREASLVNGMAIVRRAKSLRGFGAAALHLAYVAAGRIEGFWEYDLNAWDIAAGALLVEEAGGVITAIDGSAYELAVRNVVACGQAVLAEDIRNTLATPYQPESVE
ncbi:inositol monophosphatase family protein [Alicyclobacillus ferrooxydans]|uniref:Inositol-1-monophosphatase n=1 Tax=Alicyclobacillus ferrooxydans TaxID=471514 RepID=A0A0P9EWW7_9BACL|nr:inositol monophosphatase family protein [Alicyclobacillus ferrooxydans]KPV43610.1 hypothetical protein AN477_11405 [Alicyclobacillus ferrooxydans]